VASSARAGPPWLGRADDAVQEARARECEGLKARVAQLEREGEKVAAATNDAAGKLKKVHGARWKTSLFRSHPAHACPPPGRQDKNRYKRMCVALQQRLKDTVRDHGQQLQLLAQRLETKSYECSAMQQQLRDVERQRDELKMRLSLGDVGAAAGLDLGMPVEDKATEELQVRLRRRPQAGSAVSLARWVAQELVQRLHAVSATQFAQPPPGGGDHRSGPASAVGDLPQEA
jgi:hypothetical protein